MPSDPRTARALAALAQPIAEFRALVQGALTQADAFIAALHATAEDAAATARAELGEFAARRMDPAAFAARFPRARLVDPVALATLRRAADVLRSVRFSGEDMFVLDVPPGERLGVAVSALVDRAIDAAGLRPVLTARRAGGLGDAPDRQLRAADARTPAQVGRETAQHVAAERRLMFLHPVEFLANS